MPDCVRCFAVTAEDKNSLLHVCAFDVLRKDGSFPSLTPSWTEAHLFEREIAEQFGIRPEGHPWLKPVRGAPRSSGPDLFPPPAGANTRLDAYPFLASDERGDARGRRGSGPRRDHRARALPLPLPRREGPPPRDLARLPAPRRRAEADRRPGPPVARRRGVDRGRHGHRACARLLPGARGALGDARERAGDDAPRHRARARAVQQPRRRPGRPRERRRLPARGGVVRRGCAASS